MRLTPMFGAVIVAIGLAACASPAPTPAPTSTATPTLSSIPTSSPSDSASPAVSASPSPSAGPCGYVACGTGWGYSATCAVAGTAQGGSLVVTFTAGAGQAAPVVPASIAVDGNTLDVTSNPFTSGPYGVGVHSITIEGFTGPFTVPACPAPTPTPAPALAAVLAPKILPACQPRSDVYDWEVYEAWQGPDAQTKQDQLGDFSIDFSSALNLLWVRLPSSQSSFYFDTPVSDGKTLSVRWHDYPGAGTATAAADTTACS